MEIIQLLKESREIWSNEKTSREKMIPRMGKVFGDICKNVRDEREGDYDEKEFKKELGNNYFFYNTLVW